MKKKEAILMIGIVLMSAFALVMPVTAQDTVVSIEDVSLGVGGSKTVPIMIEDVTGVVGTMVNISYNSSVVHITGVANSDFCPGGSGGTLQSVKNNTVGFTRIIAQNYTTAGLTGDVKLAEVTLEAKGDADDWSYLNLTIDELYQFGEVHIDATPDNGVFTIEGEDTTPPTITDVSPEDGATDVSVVTTISVTFSEAMNEASAEGAFSIDSVTGTFSWVENMMTFTPDADLAYNTAYTATVSTAAEDLAGNPLADDYSWAFTTEPTDETPPTIPDVSPEDGATDVSVGTAISVTFSEAMNEASAEGAFSIDSVLGAFSWVGNTMTFTPDADLAYNTAYNATVSTAAEDLAGNPLADDHSWEFTTELSDTTPPTITDVSPTNDATKVSRTTTISATFSEVMNETSAHDAFSTTPYVPGAFSWVGNTMTFTPSANLAYDTTYTVTISTTAKDEAGNPLADAYSWSFTTKSKSRGGGAPRDTDNDGYTDIQEMLADTDGNDPCDPDPECAACLATKPAATPTPTPTAAPTAKPTTTPAPTAEPTAEPAAEPTPTEEPGFEAVFAIAGLLAVAYLALRRKSK